MDLAGKVPLTVRSSHGSPDPKSQPISILPQLCGGFNKLLISTNTESIHKPSSSSRGTSYLSRLFGDSQSSEDKMLSTRSERHPTLRIVVDRGLFNSDPQSSQCRQHQHLLKASAHKATCTDKQRPAPLRRCHTAANEPLKAPRGRGRTREEDALTRQPADVGPGHPAEEDTVQVRDLQPGDRAGRGGKPGPAQPGTSPHGSARYSLVLLHGPLRPLAAVEKVPEGHGGQRGPAAPARPRPPHSPVELGEDVDGGARVAAAGRHHLHVHGVGPRQARARAAPPLAGPHVPRDILRPPRRRGTLGHGRARAPRQAAPQRPRQPPHPRAAPRPGTPPAANGSAAAPTFPLAT